jgi:magnesium chelatase subunit D
VRDAWLATLNELHPQARRLPNHADAERLLGGLDLSATLQTGKAVQQAGLLQQTSPTVLLLPMAERLPDDTAAILGQVLDQGMVGSAPTCIGLAALDEALDDEPPLAGGLQERLGIWLDLRQLGRAVGSDEETQMMQAALPLQDMQAMRQHVQQVQANDAQMQALCQTAMALGVDSLRAPVAALRLACVLSGLRGFDSVQDEDLGRAARLVITPRATRVPPPPEQPEQEPAPPEPQEQEPPPEQDPADNPPEPPEPPQDEDITPQQMADVLLEAALATLPVDVLRQLAEGSKPLAAGRGQGRSGDRRISLSRGTPLPPRQGNPRQGARLHILATLNAAVPRQKLRQTAHARTRVAVRMEDVHIHRFAEHSPTCLIFAIDASGSAALHRLAEAKGAVELLLTQSYARRDQVCVIGFRGTTAEVLLPPTKSLVRAKRSLSGLPGGGGTPLATAIQSCLQVALAEKRLGHSPSLVMLCDGRPNVGLQGQGGRAQALEDALTLAGVWRGHGLPAIWLDTSARPEPQAQQLAQAMGARYVPLPLANSQRMAQAVQTAL